MRLLRFRRTVPVGHHERVFCGEAPAWWSTLPMVWVDTLGRPSGAVRRAFWSVHRLQEAVPSASGAGWRRASRRMRSRAAWSYRVARRVRSLGFRATNPSALKRAIRCETASPERRPIDSAACWESHPRWTAKISEARATRVTDSLVERLSLVRMATSSSVRGHRGSILRRDMMGSRHRSPFMLAAGSPNGNGYGR